VLVCVKQNLYNVKIALYKDSDGKDFQSKQSKPSDGGQGPQAREDRS
jgi:hypothetical protein